MARSDHPTLTAADRFERSRARRSRPIYRRIGSRAAARRFAIAEAV